MLSKAPLFHFAIHNINFVQLVRNRIIFWISILLLLAVQGISYADISRVSIASDGSEGDSFSRYQSVSVDGRYITFASNASNLVVGDTNAVEDIFVHDTLMGTTSRVSINSTGEQANNTSYRPVISADGRYVAFSSLATNLVLNDTNLQSDIFVHDRQTGETQRVSVASDLSEANNGAHEPGISGDGRYVVFVSNATNLVANDTNDYSDIFLHDRQTSVTQRVSLWTSGAQIERFTTEPVISEDGRYVAFRYLDVNQNFQVYRHDIVTGETIRISTAADGSNPGYGSSDQITISADGRYVAFRSSAANLVANDTNGYSDVFIRDTLLNSTIVPSAPPNPFFVGNSGSNPSISFDGRFVAFTSAISNIVANDTNNRADVFVYDIQTDEFKRANLTATGSQAIGGDSGWSGAVLTGDGLKIAFDSNAYNLVVNDLNTTSDVFLADTGFVVIPPGNDEDISVSGSASAGVVLTTDTNTLNFTVTNELDSLAEAVMLNMNPPADVNISSMVSSQGTCDRLVRPATCTIGDIPIGGTVTISAVVSTVEAKSISANITVTSAGYELTPANNLTTINYIVNKVPTVNISSPTNGSSVTDITTVSLQGTATDYENGNTFIISNDIQWSSNLDGILGTGASLSTLLSVGSHTITANVTDQYAATASTSVSITVTESTGADDNFLPEGQLPVGWDNGTNAWLVDSSTNFEGLYSLKAATISHGQSSSVSLTGTFDSGVVSFARRVSSESNYDYLRFYIDGVLQAQWSGEIYWSTVSYNLTSGDHTLTWTYYKDGSVSTGSDTAWIDNVTVPSYVIPPPPPAPADFPAGGVIPENWVKPASATSGWSVSSVAASGTSSLKSNIITHVQSSGIEVSRVFPAGTVQFTFKVSSEANYDYLRFYIDGIQQAAWSGEQGWVTVSYPVTAGQHTLRWMYTKDYSVSRGSDAAWIDNVVLPGE